ncbi:MAG: sugar phosphate isomerase/epimerase [Lentisphaerae bacterium]|jgi:sugar phosphate isomerase/epimerase|nr:sugar phosphate isomerase/epimerase [Lentisphaerota bacterium]
MIKLGVNTVLFQKFDLATAMTHIAWAGYDGIEISAIKGMCEHLDLDRWQEQTNEIHDLAAQHNLELLSTEVASLDETRLQTAFDACAAIGIPVVNVGPGGKSDIQEDLDHAINHLAKMAELAAQRGVTLCVKAHVNASIYSTPTTLAAMERIANPAFGIDMDPSHIYRAGELPEEALPQVISRVRHIHIRDCKGRGPSPGAPCNQACGRGDVNLYGYFEAMVKGGYSGPVNLEVIGAGDYELGQRTVIAAESYGYMNACLKHLGAR